MKLEFRFYDTRNKEMIYSSPTEAKDVFFEVWERTPKASPIMVYTSIHDINNKKIFAGDIVEYKNPSIFGEPDMTGYVVFEEAAFWINNPRKMMANALFSETATLKVLGNIYENRELFASIMPNHKEEK